MTLDCSENRESVIEGFPGLLDDPDFMITSNVDRRYNCIAWANGRDDVWMWPDKRFDGVFWPIKEEDLHYSTLIKLFESKGFSICESPLFDPKLVKVALYINANDEFTHAARQDRKGRWKTKLGESFDIIHGTPYTIEGELYGTVKVIMSAKF